MSGLKTQTMRPISELGELEQRVMDAMWQARRATVHDICRQMQKSRAYTTIMTTLDRLHKKGLLSRTREGRSFVYVPAVDRNALAEQKTRRFWDLTLAHGVDQRPVLSCFIDTVTEHDVAALDQLEELIRNKRKQLR